MTTEIPIEKLTEFVRQELRGYSNPEYIRQDGMTYTFRIVWQKYGLRRLIQIDQDNPESPTSRRELSKGNNLDNATKIAAKIQREGVLVPIHTFGYEDTKYYGLKGAVTVVDEIIDDNGKTSRNLEEILLDERHRLGDSDTIDIARQYLHIIGDINDGIGVIGDTPIVHRDLKPSNIVVKRVKGRPIVKVVDWSLARIVEGEREYAPFCGTGGTRQTVAPELRIHEGEEPVKYDEKRAEVFSAGATLAILLSGGKQIIDYDGDKWKFAVDVNDNTWLPRKFRKYHPILKRALQENPENRYLSVGQLYKEFEAESNRPSKLKKWLIGASLAGLLLGGLAGYSYFHDIKKGLELEVNKAQVNARFEKRNKSIDIWLQSECLNNLRKDPENKKNIFFTPDSGDNFQMGELRGWMDLLNPYEYKEDKYYGDSRTAMAAFLDSTMDHFPLRVFEALMQLNGIKGATELERRLKEKDKTLNLNFDKLQPYLEKIDHDLYWKVWSVSHRGADNIERMVYSDCYSGVDLQIAGARKVYELRLHRDAAVRVAYEKASGEYGKNPGIPASGIVGDAYKIQAETKLGREMEKIEAEYRAGRDALSRRHFGGR